MLTGLALSLDATHDRKLTVTSGEQLLLSALQTRYV